MKPVIIKEIIHFTELSQLKKQGKVKDKRLPEIALKLKSEILNLSVNPESFQKRDDGVDYIFRLFE